MATAAVASCSLSALSSTFKSRYYCISSQRVLATSGSITCKGISQDGGRLKRDLSFPPRKTNRDKESMARKKIPGKCKDNSSFLGGDDSSEKEGAWKSQSRTYKSLGTSGEDELQFDLKDQQVESKDLKDADYFDAVVKVYCTHTPPEYSLPWQKQRQYSSTGSAFIVGERKLLTNAHCVEDETQVKVKRRGDDTKYTAKVLALGFDCDIALLSVENEKFWVGTEPLKLGSLPQLQDAVTLVGYPLGGDTISVTKGVVSRIEVTSYGYGTCDLLSIQIDAAINPGNSGGPAFNDRGECIGVAFQVIRSEDVENIGYVIPTTILSHFLDDYNKNGKYTGFPCLGVLLQNIENPAMREYLKVPSNEGVLVRRIEPTSDAYRVLKEGDVIVSFDGVNIGGEATVPFRSNERIAFRHLLSQKFVGDTAELGIIRAGSHMKVQIVLSSMVHLVPYHILSQPSYFIIAGLVFTPLTGPLINEEGDEALGLQLMTKAHYCMARFKEEQIVILSQVLAHDANSGYEDMSNQQILKFNGTQIKNIHHLAHLVDSCKDTYLVFEFEGNYLVILNRESACAANVKVLRDYGIPSRLSPDLSEPYVDPVGSIELRRPEVPYPSFISIAT